ncbi:MAG: DUF1211 domain-containing protein [Planctomycetes bacterium]|nr:DUF1211 domain-containing protein [Planctomycetota bacterium]MCB9917663.1 DUF1211 domain-containing protein [Planctomycetota bacterium]
MNKSRLEAVSDGVLAIVITIMVLELKVPAHSPELSHLRPLLPVFSSYVLSFVYLAIYWNNHHHMFHTAKHASAGIMWANMHCKHPIDPPLDLQGRFGAALSCRSLATAAPTSNPGA